MPLVSRNLCRTRISVCPPKSCDLCHGNGALPSDGLAHKETSRCMWQSRAFRLEPKQIHDVAPFLAAAVSARHTGRRVAQNHRLFRQGPVLLSSDRAAFPRRLFSALAPVRKLGKVHRPTAAAKRTRSARKSYDLPCELNLCGAERALTSTRPQY